MLLDLMEERQKWLNQRDEAIREITRLSKLIRATRNVVRFSGPNCAENKPPGFHRAASCSFPFLNRDIRMHLRRKGSTENSRFARNRAVPRLHIWRVVPVLLGLRSCKLKDPKNGDLTNGA